ncbi:somatostatin-2-like [Boleophthalmus pectinirostris]|uniref:somatostatin-2-like n=1 Tax=Boleophthalmus pectinirostris TaxID=150288 RepID=UPI000A1C6ADC|nr:somatostatin-2-like [Boleophthalmus pectinirostris]
MQSVRGSVLLLSMLVLALSSEADQSPVPEDLGQDLDQDLDLELTRHRLLQRARTAGLLTQRAVEDLLLAQMSLPEANVPKPPLPKESSGHVTLQRSVESNNNLPSMERKAGCKNFYWKGKTAC